MRLFTFRQYFSTFRQEFILLTLGRVNNNGSKPVSRSMDLRKNKTEKDTKDQSL